MDELLKVALSILFLFVFSLFLCVCLISAYSVYKRVIYEQTLESQANPIARFNH